MDMDTTVLYSVQVLWKNIKINLKKTAAEARRERFKTGGGPANKDTDQLDDLLTGIMENQQPLENIPDDDHLDSSDEGSHTHTTMGIFWHFVLSFQTFLSLFHSLSFDVEHFSFNVHLFDYI